MVHMENDGWGQKREATKVERIIRFFMESYGDIEGVPTMKVYEDFEDWQIQMFRKTGNNKCTVGCGNVVFTRTVNRILQWDSVRESINGRQVSVFTKGVRSKKIPMTHRKAEAQSLILLFMLSHKKDGERFIGRETSDIHLAYRMWLMLNHPHALELSQSEFTRQMKKELNCEVKRKRIRGKQVSVFWDSGATRLDLGDYLD